MSYKCAGMVINYRPFAIRLKRIFECSPGRIFDLDDTLLPGVHAHLAPYRPAETGHCPGNGEQHVTEELKILEILHFCVDIRGVECRQCRHSIIRRHSLINYRPFAIRLKRIFECSRLFSQTPRLSSIGSPRFNSMKEIQAET